MKNIQHIVYLMLENRSMDSVLGWLYEKDKPQNYIPKSNTKPFNGLQTGNYFNPKGKKGEAPVTKILPSQGQQIPNVDPHEEFQHVKKQIAITNGVAMGGFYNDFATVKNAVPNQIMETYTPDSLPVLNSLAKNFAVSDEYFSSIPTQTNCNRAFAGTGNSLGYYYNNKKDLKAWVNNSFGEIEKWALDVTFNQKTVWGVLNDQGFGKSTDWMIYYNNKWPTNKFNNYCFTQDLFWPTLGSNPTDNFADINQFLNQAKTGTLPTFSFLEPAWYLKKFGFGWNGNDYHPPGNVGCGEQFLYDIYNALKSNPKTFTSTLLIINFDEHGGTYDHVTPPSGVKAPWENPKDQTPKPQSTEGNFDFKSLGVRVPLILVSPLIEEKTIIRSDTQVPFDHTSVLATVLNHFGLTDRTKWGLGSRTANAPTIEDVITLSPEKARTEVDIASPLKDNCKADEDASPNDLQKMILHRFFVRTIEQKNWSKKKFNKLYEQHFKEAETMHQINEATRILFSDLDS